MDTSQHPLLTAETTLSSIPQFKPDGKPFIATVRKTVGRHFNVLREDMLSDSRCPEVVFPRQIAMYLANKFTGQTLQQIGHYLGNRDHTTVLYAIHKIEDLIQQGDLELIAQLNHLEAQLTAAATPPQPPTR